MMGIALDGNQMVEPGRPLDSYLHEGQLEGCHMDGGAREAGDICDERRLWYAAH